MAVEFRLPDLGDNVASGEVINVLVSVGDEVGRDQPVIELETDKAVIEVPCTVSGRVSEVHVSQGDTAAVEQLVLTIDASSPTRTDAGAPPAAPAEPLPQPTPEPGPPVSRPPRGAPAGLIEVALPELGEGIDTGEIAGVLVQPGDSVAMDQPLVEIEFDKGIAEVPSTAAGAVRQIHVSVGDRVSAGHCIASLEVTDRSSNSLPTSDTPPPLPDPSPSAQPGTTSLPPAVQPPTPAPVAVSAPGGMVPAAPSVRRLAREIGIDVSQVRGSGPGGRISEEDVKAHSRALNQTSATAPATSAMAPLPDMSKWGEIERKPMSNVRRATAEHMSRSWATIPHATQFDRADVTELEVWRQQYGPRAQAAGGKLTPTAIILKVAASALKRYPKFNASVDVASKEIVYKRYCHIGVAVDTDRGLLVPVVRDVDGKNMIELAVELAQTAERARAGKLDIEEMRGGCFTISNLGGIGGDGLTPIVNAPEVAILGVARTRREPVWSDDGFSPRLMMPLALSYDHRLIDGADGARFLRWIAEALENPLLLALEG